MNQFKDTAACWIARALIFVFGILPLELSLKIGSVIGRIVFYLSSKRHVAYINLKNALGDQLTPEARWKVIRDHYSHIGQNVAEILSFKKLTREYVEKHIKFNGFERFQDLAKSGSGGVLLTAHLGNWELLHTVAGILGAPMHLLAAPQKFPKLDALLNQFRETHGAVAVTRGSLGIRALIRALHDGKLIGVVCDQSAGKTEGILLPFFGRVTSVPSGPFELAVRTGVPMITCLMMRRKDIEHEVFIGKTLRDDPEKTHEDRVRSLAEQYLNEVESFITAHPDQWLWSNKRWKYSWSRKILILSDGKAGHFKQSEAVAELFEEHKEFHGRSGLRFETQKVHIEYRSKWHQTILSILAPVMKPWIQGRLHWLRPFLKKESAKALETATGDFIIAAGSGLAPIQQLLARETGAKKVVIMKPPFPYSAMHYDLAIVPAHDNGPVPRDNFRCVIMPSAYQVKDRSKDIVQLKKKLRDCEKTKVAVFVGGKAHGFNLTVSDMEKLTTALRKSAKRVGSYMVTTSRRTLKPIEQFLKSMLIRDAACQLLVIANEDNPPYAASGMMGIADILIVTEDSLAMISEAVGTGKKVIVLSLGQGDLPEKHHRFHHILEQRGLVTISCLEDLETNLREIMKKPAHPAIHRERAALVSKIGELL